MPQQKYMIQGEFTLDEINAIKKSLEFFTQANAEYEDGDIENQDDEEWKQQCLEFNKNCRIAKRLYNTDKIHEIKTRKNTKQHLINENDYLMKQIEELKKENKIHKQRLNNNILKLPSVPK